MAFAINNKLIYKILLSLFSEETTGVDTTVSIHKDAITNNVAVTVIMTTTTEAVVVVTTTAVVGDTVAVDTDPVMNPLLHEKPSTWSRDRSPPSQNHRELKRPGQIVRPYEVLISSKFIS